MAVFLSHLRRPLAAVPSLTLQNVTSQCASVCAVHCRNINYTTEAMPDLEEHIREKKKTYKFLTHNDKIFPPTRPNEEIRPAFVCHIKENIKYSPKKMWYIATLVRGMSVDEAVKQLTFVNKKGAPFVKEAILEAQQLAVEKHYVEFKSNLWVAESLVNGGEVIKGLRRHARGRFGRVEYKYCHYFVKLEEGKPPENFYNRPSQDKETLLNDWLLKMRRRKVSNSL